MVSLWNTHMIALRDTAEGCWDVDNAVLDYYDKHNLTNYSAQVW
jgi:hypothetical protein